MENKAYMLGMFAGIVVGLIVMAVMLVWTRKGNKAHTEYDERQKAARGVAFQYGFFTLLFGNLVLMVVDVFDIALPAEPAMRQFVLSALGITVYLTYCIWHDAYYAMNEKLGRVLILFAVIFAINLLGGISNLKNGNVVADGILTTGGTNLVVSILFLYILAVTGIKYLKDRRGDEE